MKLVKLRRLKIGRRSRLREWKRITNLLKIKFTLDRSETGWNSASEHDLDDRESMPGDQGGAVVPDDVTAHKEIRPETHWLFRTECKEVSRLIKVG